MQGALLVDKPKTWTSFDAVNYVRRMVATAEGKKPKNTKVGHIGTLDPLATGLLVLLIGKEYTRKATVLTKLDKTYEVTLKLGETSTTGDDEGTKTAVSDTVPSTEAILAALTMFTGEIMQTPPAFSAIKVDGKRAYDLAREGKEVKLSPRPVTIYALTITKYEYPFVEFTAEVSSGTYIRSLAEDLGSQLTTGAYMSDLRRTRIADFDIKNAVAVQGLDVEKIQEHLMELP